MLIESSFNNAPCENESILYGSVNKPFSMGALSLIDMAKVVGIYKIISLSNSEKVYIGSSVNVLRRITMHKTHLIHNRHRNSKLQRHANKYGIDDLVFTIIEQFDFISKEHLLEREQFYLDTLNPWFNISLTASSVLGIKHPIESRERHSKARLGQRASSETRYKIGLAGKGRKAWNLGINRTNEEILSISNSRKIHGHFEYIYGILIKYVYCYDDKLNLLSKFNSVTEASNCLLIKRKTISERCNHSPNKLYNGFYFHYVLEVCDNSNDYFSQVRIKMRNKRIIKSNNGRKDGTGSHGANN